MVNQIRKPKVNIVVTGRWIKIKKWKDQSLRKNIKGRQSCLST